MDFIAGETLEEHLLTHGGKLPVKEALKLGIRLCKVLHYLHTRQPPIIFRDLKPANVMLTPEGKLYLIDFGIARHFKRGKAHDTIAFGSPGYAAPEQYGKAQTTPRSDIYSLGVLLHQLLTGQDPAGSSSFQFAPLNMPAPEGLEKLLRQMTELDPQQRPPSMAAVEFKLEQQAKAWNQGQQVGGASAALKPRQRKPANMSYLARRVTQPVGGWTIGGILFLLILIVACLFIIIGLAAVSGAHHTHGLPFEMPLLF
jgi:serine/threonine protein kinase